METWKFIIGLNDYYQISNFGNVRSVDRKIGCRFFKGQSIVPQLTYGGYLSVQLRVKVKKSIFYIHRLVANHFLIPDKKRKFINHIDENRLNNHFSNLEWVTKSENAKHSTKGKIQCSRKFTSEQILNIRQMHKSGLSLYKIAKNLNENSGTISNIVNRKTYNNL